MVEQLSLSVERPVVDAPSGRQHRAVLAALRAAGARGLSGEEAALFAGITLTSTATTRLEEMSVHSKCRDRFPVPLVYRSAKKERANASGRLSHIWFLTDVGQAVARVMEEEAR